jgi:4-hydroxybenzoate polyprenyltransferase
MPPLHIIILFFLGATLMRGAGCTINDILDRDIDARVSRTAARPLPAGLITLRGAWLWLALQLALAALILFMLPPRVWAYGLAAVPLVLLYPAMKRITWWPQAWLGLTFNWGLWLGATYTGAPPPAGAIFFYLGAVLWTIGYDTIYAAQDVDDDAVVGVKSTARLFGTNIRIAVAVLYIIAMLLWLSGGVVAALGWGFYAGVAVVAALLARQFFVWQNGNALSARTAFISNKYVGAALAFALLAGYLTA